MDYKSAAAEIRDQISCLIADTKSVRAHLPKGDKKWTMFSFVMISSNPQAACGGNLSLDLDMW